MQPRFVSYYRVSTVRQGQSGLGLEAQKAACEKFVALRGGAVIEAFTEVESGKINARPQLQKALHLAKVTGSTLLIAKLDRLSRNAAFLLTLRDAGVKFCAADLPEASDLTIGILALVAQNEAEAISRRTKEGLAAAKARGRKLGNPNGAAALRRAGKGNAYGVEAIKRSADQHAANLKPVIDDLRQNGITSLGAMADALNARNMLTARGGAWHRTTVRNLLDRLAG